ncbi:hypothetical protein ACIP3D_27255 [Streptomyces longwoodensis]|uniref:hypothetical protein n=1 Tax=Streptomyces longwoodensis TaxID=68231 RepID=UPI00382E986A
MMAQHIPPAPGICPVCDGFASVAVTLGGRDTRGHLRTVTVYCPACRGTGTAPVRRDREGARA